MTMSREQIAHQATPMLIGAATTMSLGQFMFQALGTLLLGIIGALGGWLFTAVLRPKLDKIIKKIKGK